ncbi:MAG: ABC transporter ATP-binding protein [Sphaerobacteraceae bacterium]|nr:MAG: ABC transporter ATP-binding protein [Sphaerobacteraceae bacterium]
MAQTSSTSTPGYRGQARQPRIICDNLVKIYKIADLEVVALQGLDLAVDPGEMIAIVGASGSGKSTLLNILGGLDVPSAGRIEVAGYDLLNMTESDRVQYRSEVIGFIWQQTARNLLPYLSARENVELPMTLAGAPGFASQAYAEELLQLVGLGERMDHKPTQLSGGEQQRVAIAVSLANGPSVILADEPTGELDTATSGEIFDIFQNIQTSLDVTIVIVTHDVEVSDKVHRTVSIRDGRVSSETLRFEDLDGEGDGMLKAEEFAVLDKAGRLQIPSEFIEELQLERRVRLKLDPDRVNVFPDDSDRKRDRE